MVPYWFKYCIENQKNLISKFAISDCEYPDKANMSVILMIKVEIKIENKIFKKAQP